jgi:hypothetical protein
MDAPVEELGAPAEPFGPSGAPDLGSAIHPGQSNEQRPKCGRRAAHRAGDALAERPRYSERDARSNPTACTRSADMDADPIVGMAARAVAERGDLCDCAQGWRA